MQNKIIYASAVVALLIAFTTEAVLVSHKNKLAQLETQAVFSAETLKRTKDEIAKLKAVIEAQTADNAEKLRRAETEIANLKGQIEAQIAINTELSKAAEERKARAEAAAQALAKQRRAPAAPQPKLP